MKRILNIGLLLISIAFLSSCVSQKKYKSAVAQAEQLQTQVNDLNNQVSGLQKQVTDLTDNNKAIVSEFARYKESCDDCQQKLATVKAALAEQYNTMAEVMSRLSTALDNFKANGVDVYSRNGNIYVSLSEDLLYKSGSSKLGESGKTALGSLAGVLNEYPKLKVIVVGNTDTVRVKGVADNWSLSTERANGVVRILVKDYSVDPARLTSAGHGKFDPIGDNSTTEGRAKNRRTDIILNPDLERIWKEAEAQKQ